jgi:hypothetical protein
VITLALVLCSPATWDDAARASLRLAAARILDHRAAVGSTATLEYPTPDAVSLAVEAPERLAVVVTDDPDVAMRALRLGLGGAYWLANLEVWEHRGGEWAHLPVSDDGRIAAQILRGVDGQPLDSLAPTSEAYSLALARRAHHGREPKLIERFTSAHAGHDAFSPGRAYDLVTWRVRYPIEPTRLMLNAIGVPRQANLQSGRLIDGAQVWDYTERVPAAAGSQCEWCGGVP